MQVIHESIADKAKKFIANNKGKLAALAGLAALGGAGYAAYKQGALEDAAKWVGQQANAFADKEHQIKVSNATESYNNAVNTLKKLGIKPNDVQTLKT